jgi:hypothetical protein
VLASANALGKQWDERPPPDDGINVPEWKCQQPLEPEGASIMQITTVGLDLAKNVFQVHGVNGES